MPVATGERSKDNKRAKVSPKATVDERAAFETAKEKATTQGNNKKANVNVIVGGDE